MAKKGNFTAGLILGIAAGFAAKYLADNKEEVKKVVGETTVKFTEGAKDFADYAGTKFEEVSGEVAKTAGEYIDYAKGQFKEIKDSLSQEFALYTDEEAEASASDECEAKSEEGDTDTQE